MLKLKQLKKDLGRIKESDFTIVIIVAILVIFGVVMVFSASYYKSISDEGSPFGYLKKQLVLALIGSAIMYVASIVDYHVYKKMAIPVLAGSVGLLLLLFTPLGVSVGGATRWLNLGFMTLMPGEIAKVAVILFVSAFLADDPEKIFSIKRGIAPIFGVTVAICGMIAKQPNLSTAITVFGISVGIMFIAGLKWRYIMIPAAAGGVGLFAISRSGLFWANRINSFMDPFADPQGNGYQVVQSLLALGTGGLFGLGLGKSVQKNLYLPEPQNDFILAIIGEELGFLGVMILLLAFALLVWRCFVVSMDAPDQFGMLLAGGITLMIGIQVVLNVAVVTSSMPPTGIALPFISYGGNALWIFMGLIGVVLNVSRQSRILQRKAKENNASARVEKVRARKAREMERGSLI